MNNVGNIPKCAFGCFWKTCLPCFHRCSRRQTPNWAAEAGVLALQPVHVIHVIRRSGVSASAVVVSVWQQNKLLKLVLHWKVILIWSCFTLSPGERVRGGEETAVNRWARQRCELAPLEWSTMPCNAHAVCWAIFHRNHWITDSR